jgi:hypothetical protein
MKIAGIDPKLLPPEDTLVLPRGDGNIVFKARGLSDMDEFNKLCPEPTPPVISTNSGQRLDTEDANYLSDLKEHGKRRWAYYVVKSLQDMEWDTVKPDQPSTWPNWDADLKSNGFTHAERNRVFNLVLEANSLSESKLDQARAIFLLGRPEAPKT